MSKRSVVRSWLKRRVFRPVVEEAGCQACDYFAPSKRFVLLNKRVVRPVRIFSR
jgi:hypothetical protein